MTEDDFMELLAATGRGLSKGGAADLASAVRSAGSADKLRKRADALATPVQQKRAIRLAKAWESSVFDAEAVAVGIRSAEAASRAERDSEAVELTWTGPKPIKPAVSRNDEALFEVVGSATESLLVVSYATYKVPELVAMLGEAVGRGVRVDLVLEFHGRDADQPQSYDPIQGLGGPLASGIVVWEWPIDQRPADNGKVGYIHVKCAVADRDQAFVSSANLTVYAMEKNMELGVVIRGGDVPRRIADHFRALMDDGTLQEVQLT